MKQYIKNVIETTLKHEGGYVNNPDDKGGATNYGITEGVARANGYLGSMRELPLEFAVKVYYRQYWVVNNLDLVFNELPLLAEVLFDFGVNAGPPRAAVIIMQVLNSLSYKGRRWEKLVIKKRGNKVGKEVINILSSASAKKLRFKIVFAVLCKIAARDVDISNSREANQSFTVGWLGRRMYWFKRLFKLKGGM